MSLKKITTEITYKVPGWGYCNLQGTVFGQPAKEKCRFCVKEKGYHRCALYNMVLETAQGTLIVKAPQCVRAMAGFKSVVEDVEDTPIAPTIEPKKLMKMTIDEYDKVRKQLINQGYPEAMAARAAAEYVLGGN